MIEMNQLTLTDYQSIKLEIKNNLQNIVVSFVEIGYYLKQIRDDKMYLEDGYKDIWDFAAGEYKLDRTAASRFMSINDKYSIDGNSRYLQEKYQGFGKSTLTEMLTLPVEDYELITPDTKIEDIRELKKAERECKEEEESQIDGQESLLSIMPDVVPESEKPKKEEVTIKEVLRELFKPREMKERLDSLVNMDPDSSEMQWWVGDFNQSGNRTYKKMPFFLFFYSLTEGMKIKNVKTGEIKVHTYKDFYFMVRAAFHQETVRGSDVWTDAFGEEYEEELRAQEEAEKEKAMIEAEKKMIEKQKAEKARAIKENQGKSVVKEPKKEVSEQKEGGSASALKEIKENSTFENEKEDVDNVNVENETEKAEIETEKPEIVTGTVEEEEVNLVCDIAQIPKSAIMTSLERAKWVNEHVPPQKRRAVTVDADTYQDIITGWKRFIDLGYKTTDGDILTFYNGENKPIEAIVICYECIPEGNGVHIAGFEVLDYGQEE